MFSKSVIINGKKNGQAMCYVGLGNGTNSNDENSQDDVGVSSRSNHTLFDALVVVLPDFIDSYEVAINSIDHIRSTFTNRC